LRFANASTLALNEPHLIEVAIEYDDIRDEGYDNDCYTFNHRGLNEHWFTTVARARVVIEAWRREYNDERPKKALGGLTPTADARQLTQQTETAKVTAGL